MKTSRILVCALFCCALAFGKVENVEFIAKEVHKNGDITEASGDVLVYSQSYLASAKRAKYDEKNEIVELFDDVNMMRNNQEATHSNYAKINLKTNEITTDSAFAMHQSKELWLASDEFCSSDSRLSTTKSIVSSCNVEDPDWHIEYSSGYLDKESKFLHLFNPVFYGNLPLLGQTPLFYLPYFGFSTDTTRRTGLLPPHISYSNSEGLFYEQPIYFAPYNEWDLELDPQVRTNRGVGVYGTFRFADSPYSNGAIRAGIFNDTRHYKNKENLKNRKHMGVDVTYDRDRLAKYLLDGDYGEGFYVRFTHLNDVDYLNLGSGSNANSYDSLVHSKLNYFINTKEHYFGLYADYYIDTAKIGTKNGNKDTLQELPSAQYHSYLDTFLSKNITYSLDIKYHNFTRRIGTKAQQFEMNLPLGLNYTLPGGWANLSLNENLYASYINYANSYEVLGSGGKRDLQSDKYARQWSEFGISSDLARAYDIFGGLFHTMNLSLSYIQPGYKHDEITKTLYSYDKNEIEDTFINDIDEIYTKQAIKAGISQYLFDSDNEKFLRHSLNMTYYTNNSDFGVTQNKLNLYFKDFGLFSHVTYDHKHKKITNSQNGFNLTFKDFYLDARHAYERLYSDNYGFTNSEFLQANSHYTFAKNVRIFGSYAYDLDLSKTKMWRVGISQNRKCWSYGLYFSRNTEPQNTSAGPEAKTTNSVMLFFAFYPFGDFNYDVSLKSSDVAN